MVSQQGESPEQESTTTSHTEKEKHHESYRQKNFRSDQPA